MGKKLAIFQDSDENAAPSGAGKLAIFRDSDPPTVTASNPPKSKFTVFSDADAEPIPPKPRIPLGLRAAESTAPSASSSSRATGSSDAYDNDTTSSAKPPSAPVRSILKSSGARPRSFEADEEANPFASTSASSGDSNDEDTETLTRSLRENLPSTARNQSLTRKEVLNLAKDIADEAEADEEELMRAEAQRRLVLERERILDQQHQQAVQMGGMMVPLGPRIPEMPTIYDPSLTPITERTEPSSRATGTTTAGNSSMAYSASVLSGTSGRPSFIANERTFAHESEPTSTLSLTRVLKNSLHHGILEEVEGEEVDPLVGANTSFQRLAISGGGPYDPYLDEPMKRYVSACMDSDKQMIVRRNDSLLQRGSKLVSGAEIPLIGTSETLVLERKLGEGGYGVVWLASCVDATAVQSDDSDDDFSSSQFSLRLDRDPRDKKAKRSKGSLRAVKLSNSKSRIINLTYEQCLLRTARTRLAAAGSNALASLITTYDCRVYADTAILRMDFIAGGSLLDIVNVAMTADPLMAHASTGQSAGMEEIVAVFYAIEVLKTVDALHSVDVVHGDIKPENFLARWSRGGRQNDDTVSSIRAVPDEWTSFYDPSGDGGWGDRGLFIVDFGRALDLRTVAADSAGKERCFFTDFDASGKGDPAVEAWELRNKEPFHGFEIDWYGIAGVVHVLLFGKFMEITEGEPGSGLAPGSKKPEIMIATLHAMKRYWQTEEIWIPLFATLLNPPEPYATAGRAAVQSLIRKMQKWLEANCQKGGKNLRASLKKLELTVMEKSGKRAAQASSRGFGGSSVGGRSGLPVLRK